MHTAKMQAPESGETNMLPLHEKYTMQGISIVKEYIAYLAVESRYKTLESALEEIREDQKTAESQEISAMERKYIILHVLEYKCTLEAHKTQAEQAKLKTIKKVKEAKQWAQDSLGQYENNLQDREQMLCKKFANIDK